MVMPKYAARRDDSQRGIVKELLEIGFSVQDTSKVGGGFPDLLIGQYGMDFKVECKTPKGRKTALDRFSDGQSEFAQGWKGAPVIAAYTTADIVFAIQQQRRRQGWVK